MTTENSSGGAPAVPKVPSDAASAMPNGLISDGVESTPAVLASADRSPTSAASGASAPKLPISEAVESTPAVPALANGSATYAASGASAPEVNADTIASSDRADARNYAALRVGDVFDGELIEHIYGSTADYIVYESRGRLACEATKRVTNRILAMRTCDGVMAEGELILQGAYYLRLKRLAGMALASALETTDTSESIQSFDVGHNFIKEHGPVLRVFGRDEDFIVFIDRDMRLTWEYRKIPVGFLPAITEFEILNQLATTALSAADQMTAKQILGNELAIAFLHLTPPHNLFAASQDFISKRAAANVTGYYLTVTLCFGALLASTLVVCIASPLSWLTPETHTLLTGALGGVIGACISLLGRSSSLVIPRFAPRSQVAREAVVRIALGLFFGGLVVIAAKGNVAFGTFQAEMNALFLLAVAAGFGEHLVPNLLKDLSHTDDSVKKSLSEPGRSKPSSTGPSPVPRNPQTTANSKSASRQANRRRRPTSE